MELDQQVSMCEENGSRWIQCETADVRRLIVEAARYRWLREHLEFIRFEGLTCDTCDIGLDYILDCKVTGERL